ncbi:MAG: hypothetical protein COA86_18935 [Kangiella sp.]|nr:MAG: hypothetical protein COA86_18935 [Kangiella sp.]
MKNKYLVIANIEEAMEQLQDTLSELQKDPEYSEIEFKIDLEHAYHHLNYAWNIRNIEDKEVDKNIDKNYAKWSKYPSGEMLEYE